MTRSAGPVRRRKAFYVQGFDPVGPRRYHGLFGEEAPRQAALAGAHIAVGRRTGRGALASGWTVMADYPDGKVEIDYECLRWDDLVRGLWVKNELKLLADIWRSFLAFWRCGMLETSRKEAQALYLAFLFPPAVTTGFILAYALIVMALSIAGGLLAQALGAPAIAGWAPPLLLLLAIRLAWRRLDERISICWLNRCFTYMVDDAAGRTPEVAARTDDFARRLVEAAADPQWDEVLVVGHSLGCLQAVRTLARALQIDPDLGAHGPKVSLLTLGDTICAYTALPDDARFKADLAAVGACERIAWLDFTSPGDPASTGALHPLRDVVANPPEARPVRRSPRFHKLLSPASFRKVRANALSFHFQYLKATEIAGGYDVFRLICGPDHLAAAALRGAEAAA